MIYDRLGCDPTTGTSELYVRDALLIQWRYISYNNIKLQRQFSVDKVNFRSILKIRRCNTLPWSSAICRNRTYKKTSSFLILPTLGVGIRVAQQIVNLFQLARGLSGCKPKTTTWLLQLESAWRRSTSVERQKKGSKKSIFLLFMCFRRDVTSTGNQKKTNKRLYRRT